MAVTMISAASDMLKVTTIFLLTFALKALKIQGWIYKASG